MAKMPAQKILIIDDTESNRYSVRRTLTHAGYEVTESATITEGLLLLKEINPDLIILDVKLPDGNGFVVCSQLKADPATQFTPILMTSASFVQGQDKAFGLESGADGYLTTPYDSVELIANVRLLLRVRETERTLREREERFELAMKGMNDGLWDYNAASNEIFYSDRFKSMLGFEGNEFPNTVNMSFENMHPEDREKAQAMFEGFLEGRVREYKNIFRTKHKNGEYRWIMSRATAVRGEDGKPKRLVGAHTDITELKELESAMRYISEKAELANRAKTEFLANMSHEIRTPMNAIIGLSHILGTTPLNEKQKKIVDTLHVSADSMMSLINDMLDIAKIEDNMIELESIPFSLRGIVETVVSMMMVKANEKGLNLAVNYAEHVGDAFIGDPLRIKQILINLTSNAIKFTAQGSVTIAISEQMKLLGDTTKLTIKITDTGTGIPKEKLYTIFDKFTQVDSSITRKYGGSGLGLSICKSLAEHMNGNIHVASELGHGSVFTVNIPLKKDTIAKPSETAEESAFGTRVATSEQRAKRILLVEDYKANILVATMILTELGYHYDIAMTGSEAIEKFKNHHFDAILMDVQMQEMDGHEATRRIRAIEATQGKSAVPIIAMTAHALMGDKEKCLAVGMNDYISKPFDPMDLQAKLEAVMEPAM